MFDRKLIEKLEANTPNCPGCNGIAYFVSCSGYTLLKCENCGQSFAAPRSLTNTIVAAYNLSKKSTGKRLRPCIL